MILSVPSTNLIYNNQIYDFEEPDGQFEIKSLNKNNYFISLAKKKKRIILKKSYQVPHCELDDNYNDCPICLLTLVNKNVLFTPCGHIFHTKCIKMMFNTHDHDYDYDYDHDYDPYSSSHSITNYNCPLCRFNMRNSLKNLGYNIPIFINSHHLSQELIEIVNTVLNIISNSFSPSCFRTMIRDYPSIQYDTACICPFCNAAFMNILHHSHSINNDNYEIINEYINEYNSIIELIADILKIINFDIPDDYIRFIFPDFILTS